MAHDFNLHAPEGANKRKRIIGRGRDPAGELPPEKATRDKRPVQAGRPI